MQICKLEDGEDGRRVRGTATETRRGRDEMTATRRGLESGVKRGAGGRERGLVRGKRAIDQERVSDLGSDDI